MTLLLGLMSTWRFPRFSALDIVLRQSAKTLMRTIVVRLSEGLCSEEGGLLSVVWKRLLNGEWMGICEV